MKTWFRHSSALALLAFLLVTADAADKNKDPFAVGAVWEGKRVFKEKAAQEWSLKVTEREDNNFKGEITLTHPKGSVTYAVHGNAASPLYGSEQLQFRTEKKGPFFQKFWGKIKRDESHDYEISLDFEGTGPTGKEVAGTATLQTQERVQLLKKMEADHEKWMAMLKEAEKFSMPELQARIKANPRLTRDDRVRFAVDRIALDAADRKANPEREARKNAQALLIIALFAGGADFGSSPASLADDTKKFLDFQKKIQREEGR